MLKRIGSFHFGAKHGEPIESLRSAMSAACAIQCVHGSLIVLPEGFNLGRFYKAEDTAKGACYRDPDLFLEKLGAVSREFDVTFVAGLIVQRANDPEPPYNAAYLVDGSPPVEICRKREPDGTDQYRKCGSNCDRHNPTIHRGALIATLICNDVHSPRCPALMEAVDEETDRSDVRRRIVCVPACAQGRFFSGGDNLGDHLPLYNYWRGKNVVVANSDRLQQIGCNSFIADTQGEIIKSFASKGENGVILLTLDAARRTSGAPA